MTVRLNDAEWLRHQLGPDKWSGSGDDDGACVVDQNLSATTDAGADDKPMTALGEPTAHGAEPDLGARPQREVPPPAGGGDGGGVRPGRRDRRLARFGGVAAAAIVVSLLGALLLSGGDKPAGGPGNDSGTQPATVGTTAAPTPVAAEAAGVDRPLPFTASANCPAGSTSAQTLAGADPTNAFVCVRDLVDGQVIRLDLSKTYVITAISITPGWVGKDSSGASQWAQHRVVTRVQYVFNDTDRTMIVQDTGNVHGEAVQPVKHVLASKITMLILQTSRPPAETASPAPTPGLGSPGMGGLFSDPGTAPSWSPSPAPIVGPGGEPTTDPVDSTFAISNLKIIGHEAI
jgi:hypothetical protein